MSEFKVGDKVRCINADGHPQPLQKNKAYYVSSTDTPIGNVRLVGIEDRYSYSSARFEKVKSNGKIKIKFIKLD